MTIFKLFAEPEKAYGNAFLNWQKNSATEIIAYAASYRNAAMNLVSIKERQKIGSIDHAALPILFLYRHAFELYLKALAYRAAVLSINEIELVNALPRLWKEHSLVRLVEMSAPVLHASSARPLTQSGELQEQIMVLAQKIDEVDEGSYSFRYPVTSRGNSALPKHFLTNIFAFSEAMERTLDDLSQFCHSLEDERLQTSDQMKLVLHPINQKGQLR